MLIYKFDYPHLATDGKLDNVFDFLAALPGDEHVLISTGSSAETTLLGTDSLLERIERLAAAVRRFRRRGSSVRLLLHQSLGRYSPPQRRRDLPRRSPFALAAGPDGRPIPGRVCPVDVRLTRHLREVFAALAGCGVRQIWIDEDLLEADAAGVVGGCFCDRCLQSFARRFGRASRRRIVSALSEADDSRLKSDWLHFSAARIVRLCRVISASLRSVNPRVRVVIVVPSTELLVRSGIMPERLFSSLTVGGPPMVACADPSGSAPSRGHLAGYRIALEQVREHCRSVPTAAVVSSEPAGEFFKPAAVVQQQLVSAACAGAAEAVLDLFDPLGTAPTYQHRYHRYLPDVQEYIRALRRRVDAKFVRRGVAVPCSYHSDAGVRAAGLWRLVLSRFGIALASEDEPKPPDLLVLAGAAIEGFSSSVLRRMLHWPVLLDSAAVEYLHSLGLDSLVGAELGPAPPAAELEIVCNPMLAQQHYGDRYPLQDTDAGSLRAVRPITRRSQIFTELFDGSAGASAAGMVGCEHRSGRRVLVLPYALNEHALSGFLSLSRQEHLRAALSWLASRPLTAWVEGAFDLTVNYLDIGRRHLVVLQNFSFQPAADFTLWLGRLAGRNKITVIRPGDRPRRVGWRVRSAGTAAEFLRFGEKFEVGPMQSLVVSFAP